MYTLEPKNALERKGDARFKGQQGLTEFFLDAFYVLLGVAFETQDDDGRGVGCPGQTEAVGVLGAYAVNSADAGGRGELAFFLQQRPQVMRLTFCHLKLAFRSGDVFGKSFELGRGVF